MLICAILKFLSISRSLVGLLLYSSFHFKSRLLLSLFRLFPLSNSAAHLLYYLLSIMFCYLYVVFICLRYLIDLFVIFNYLSIYFSFL